MSQPTEVKWSYTAEAFHELGGWVYDKNSSTNDLKHCGELRQNARQQYAHTEIRVNINTLYNINTFFHKHIDTITNVYYFQITYINGFSMAYF